MKVRLPRLLAEAHGRAAREWSAAAGTERLHQRDASLWTGADEASWLGWLDAPSLARGQEALWREIADDGRGFAHVLVLGMGGSSLAPEVQRAILGRRPGHPAVAVLDSLHPDAIAAAEAGIDPRSTLVVVASKSGSTLEPNLLMARLLAVIEGAVGAGEAPRRFVAVTDPGSKLESFARARGFRRVVLGEPSIGGRFSALSPFGLVPAALQGVPVAAWLAGAERMAAACRDEDAARNPGAALGLLLAAAAEMGRDKLTLVAHPALASLGAWLEQLVAESTGKGGRAILPIDGEPLAAPASYGDDRLFVALRLGGALAPDDVEKLDALAAAGQPVVELDLAEPLALGAEMYRWEVATAVAGARLGVNPFDQPDVESAKAEARRLTAELESTGALPVELPFLDGEVGSLFAPPDQARLLLAGAGPAPSVTEVLRAHLARLGRGDYFAVLSFSEMSSRALAATERMRVTARAAKRVATSVGFGPRYLHSTGQAHKGGPPSGVFLIVTDRPRRDLAVPGQRLTFGQAVAAQARGDFEVLCRRGRRALRVDLHDPAPRGLELLADEIERALAGWN